MSDQVTDSAALRTRWEEPRAQPLGRGSQLHFTPVEGTVLDLGSLDSLVWSGHDGLFSWLQSFDGLSRGVVLEGLQVRRYEGKSWLLPGRCILPVQGSGRLVLGELRDSRIQQMNYGVLVLRAQPRPVRYAEARASSIAVELTSAIVPESEVGPMDLPLELHIDRNGRLESYRDLRRLERPGSRVVEAQIKHYQSLVREVWRRAEEAEKTTEQTLLNLPESSRARATAALEAACMTLAAAPTTSASRYRIYDRVKAVFASLDDYTNDQASRQRLLSMLSALRMEHKAARALAGAGGHRG